MFFCKPMNINRNYILKFFEIGCTLNMARRNPSCRSGKSRRYGTVNQIGNNPHMSTVKRLGRHLAIGLDVDALAVSGYAPIMKVLRVAAGKGETAEAERSSAVLSAESPSTMYRDSSPALTAISASTA